MRVLMVNYEFPPLGGGAGQAHENLLRAYGGVDGLSVDVLTAGRGEGIMLSDFSGNIRLYKVGIRKRDLHYWRKCEVLSWLWRARKIYDRLVEERQYDLAHAFFAFPSGWLCYRCRGRLPYVVSLRGSDVPGFNERLGLDYRLMGGLFRRIWHGAEAVVANSEGLASLARGFTPELEIGVIPNGVDLSRFGSEAERTLHDPIRLLTVCRLIRRKRIDLLIEMVAASVRSGLQVTLTIAGDGNIADELRGYVARLGVSDQVRFLGLVAGEDMAGVYRDHDVFVISSAHEGMSNAMLEAMAAGLPIVTTRCEGVAELIEGNGVVVEGADAEGLACGVRRVVSEAGAYGAMSAASVERAGRFTWSGVADRYLAIYDGIVNSGAGGGSGT